MSFKSRLDSDRFEGPALKGKVINSVAWLFGTRYIAQGISWVITILVARILSPNDYGLMGMAMIYIGLIDFINEFGVGSALIQKEELRGDEIDSSFWLILSLGGLIFLASFYFATVIADFFKNERLVLIIRILGVGFIINGIKIVPYNLMTRDLAFEKRSKAELISNISAAIITFLCALRGFGVWSLVIGHLSLHAILAGMVYMVFPWRPKLSFGFGKVSNILKFGTTVTGSRLLWYCYSRADRLCIRPFQNCRRIMNFSENTFFGRPISLPLLRFPS
jgi:O-antigen/teichoic acid export membrane protein